MTRDEIARLEDFLKRTFQAQSLEVRQRPRKGDSAEVYLNEEFIGVIYRDDEDDEVTYQFQMAILECDLN